MPRGAMNIASLEILRKELCNCGNQYVWFRHHEVSCPFFRNRQAVENEIMKEREFDGNKTIVHKFKEERNGKS